MSNPHTSGPRRVALTGGIATGKSHCLDKFRSLGVPVVDADELARAAVAPGSDGLAAVRRRFGGGVFLPSGDLDRPALGRIVFADSGARRDLEAIIHPWVYTAIDQWFRSLADRSGPDRVAFAIADVPLLYETNHAGDFSSVVVVACTPELQRSRLAARGLSAAEAEQRLASQLPLAEKTGKANFVIDTSGTYEDTDRQVTEVCQRLSKT